MVSNRRPSQADCPDGLGPTDLVQGTDGILYGMTSLGLTIDDSGTAFGLSVGLGAFVKTLPTSGQVGDQVKILGINLTGATSVTFSGIAAAFTVDSANEISTSVPAEATKGMVQVTLPADAREQRGLSGPVDSRPSAPLAQYRQFRSCGRFYNSCGCFYKNLPPSGVLSQLAASELRGSRRSIKCGSSSGANRVCAPTTTTCFYITTPRAVTADGRGFGIGASRAFKSVGEVYATETPAGMVAMALYVGAYDRPGMVSNQGLRCDAVADEL
jgi:hypothetical protein